MFPAAEVLSLQSAVHEDYNAYKIRYYQKYAPVVDRTNDLGICQTDELVVGSIKPQVRGAGVQLHLSNLSEHVPNNPETRQTVNGCPVVRRHR